MSQAESKPGTSKPSRSRKWLRRLGIVVGLVVVMVGVTTALQGSDEADEAVRRQQAVDACRAAVRSEAGIESGFSETTASPTGAGYRVTGRYTVAGEVTEFTCDVDRDGTVIDVRLQDAAN